MTKYMTPDLKVMAFMPEEEIGAAGNKAAKSGAGSNIFNDGEFGSW